MDYPGAFGERQVEGVSGVLFGSTADPDHGDEVAETFADLANELKQSLPNPTEMNNQG